MGSFDPTTNDENLPKLGSLAQAARSNQLKGARGILLTVGILNLVIHIGLIFGARSMVDAQFEKEVQTLTKKGMAFDPMKLEELKASHVRTIQLTSAGFALIGAVFVAFGLMVYRYPVPITVSALVLYLALTGINGALDLGSLQKGIIFRVIVIVALAKAIKSAIAYERERQTTAPGLVG